MADQGKALARGAAEYAIDGSITDASRPRDVGAGDVFDRTGYDGRAREVELMYSAMNRVDFNGGGNIEACLFETEA